MGIKQEDLHIVRRVLTGDMTRQELFAEEVNVNVQTYAAVALILAAGPKYLGDDYCLKIAYSKLLHEMLLVGAGASSPRVERFMAASRQHGLHRSEQKANSKWVLYLTPPPVIERLVAVYGNHEGVRRFFEDTRQALRELERRMRTEEKDLGDTTGRLY